MAISPFVGDSPATRAAICAGLAIAVVVAFWPVLGNGFINYDDREYVTKNPHIQAGLTGPSLVWAWTESYAGNWHPLTWMSHMLDWRLFGAAAAGHHAMSLFLHLAGALLLFLVLAQMTGCVWRSAFVAALFAVHPLHVESVAWASERKDVLSGVFWMLTTGAYVRYVKSPTPARRLLVAVALALGLAAKPMLVTLPFTLLLLDYWPLGRWPARAPGAKGFTVPWPLVREKIPLFALSAASSVATFAIQSTGKAVGSLTAFPLSARVSNALTSYVGYLWKTVRPAGLAVFYPHPGANLPFAHVAGAVLVLALATGFAFWVRRRAPYVLVGWLWYLGTLVPVIGLVQVGAQAMADRYTYVPLIGVFVIVAWGACDLARLLTSRSLSGQTPDRAARGRSWALAALAGFIVVTLVGCTRIQAGYWQDSPTLMRHALAVTENNYLAHSLLGASLEEQGRAEEAAQHYQEALRINANDPLALNNVGLSLAREGRTQQAIELYTRALASDADDPETNNNLGAALAQQGKIDEAIARYTIALRRRPDYVDARNNLGSALAVSGRLYEAIAQFSQALEIQPDSAEVHNNLGGAVARDGRIDEAIGHFAAALRIKPDFAQAHFNWGVALAGKGELPQAEEHFRAAIRLDPGNVRAHANLAAALVREGRIAEARQEVQAIRALGAEPPPALRELAPDPRPGGGAP